MSKVFEENLKRALAVEREYQKLTSLSGQRLTAKAYLDAAMKNARCDVKDLTRLRREFEDPDGPSLEASRYALRKIISACRSPQYPWPIAEPGKLRHLGVDAAVLAELANIPGATPMQLFALAVQITGERHPESFGSVESLPAWKQRIAELERERAELYAKLGTSYQREDRLETVDGDGRVSVSFKVSNGEVLVHPEKTAGERLIRFLIANPPAEATIS